MITLVLLPGMDGTGLLFEPFVSALGSEFPVQVVSYPTTEPLGYSDLESIVRASIPMDGPFFILAESFSGPIAISLAATSPARLKGLILCGTFARSPRPYFSLFKTLVGLVHPTLATLCLLRYFLQGRFGTDDLCQTVAQSIKPVAPVVLRARLRAILSVDVSTQLAAINVPILYLRASQDRVVPDSAANLILNIRPHAKVVSLDAPHLLLQTVPSDAARLVAEFVHETVY